MVSKAPAVRDRYICRVADHRNASARCKYRVFYNFVCIMLSVGKDDESTRRQKFGNRSCRAILTGGFMKSPKSVYRNWPSVHYIVLKSCQETLRFVMHADDKINTSHACNFWLWSRSLQVDVKLAPIT